MRLLLLSTEFPPGPGGIGTHAYQLSLQLHKLGWEVRVLTCQDFASMEEIFTFNSIQDFQIRRWIPVAKAPVEAIYRYREAARMIKDFQPDILVASGDRCVMLTAALAKRFRLPWVAVGHGAEFKLPRFWERWLARWSFENASSVVCVSKFTWKRMIDSGLKPKGGKVILNGADSQQFSILPSAEVEHFRRNFGLADAKILLTVGNVTLRKGQDIVIKALPSILKQVPNVHYIIAGLPTLKSEFEALATDLGIGDHVHFMGRVDMPLLTRLINSCDLFVLTSRQTPDGDCEGFGIAVLEAALCGKPAVVSSGSGLEEAIQNGTSGIAVPENDIEQTACAITALLSDESKRIAMAAAARRIALLGTWERRVQEYDELFRDLVHAPRKREIPAVAEAAQRVKS